MHSLVHVVWGVFKHVATGYLIYSVVEHGRGRSPTGTTASVLVVGVLFPDFVDKSLTYAGVLEYGRGFAHSLFTATAIICLVGFLTRRRDRARLGLAFGLGYVSHLPVDMYGTLLTGSQPMDTAFLLWPVVVEYSLGIPTPELPVSRTTVFTLVGISAICLWVYDGLPGVPDRLVPSRPG